jgi:hypothetical protein
MLIVLLLSVGLVLLSVLCAKLVRFEEREAQPAPVPVYVTRRRRR